MGMGEPQQASVAYVGGLGLRNSSSSAGLATCHLGNLETQTWVWCGVVCDVVHSCQSYCALEEKLGHMYVWNTWAYAIGLYPCVLLVDCCTGYIDYAKRSCMHCGMRPTTRVYVVGVHLCCIAYHTNGGIVDLTALLIRRLCKGGAACSPVWPCSGAKGRRQELVLTYRSFKCWAT